MIRWAVVGLVAAAFLTVFLAGPLATWVGPLGPVSVLVVALVFRLVVLALVVWLALWLIQRRQEQEPRL